MHHHCRSFLVLGKVRCTFFLRMAFLYLVTTGWILTLAYYERIQSTNQSVMTSQNLNQLTIIRAGFQSLNNAPKHTLWLEIEIGGISGTYCDGANIIRKNSVFYGPPRCGPHHVQYTKCFTYSVYVYRVSVCRPTLFFVL